MIRFGLVLIFGLFMACSGPSVPAVTLTNQTVEAGCGWCQYGQMGDSGCYWTVKWKDELFVVQGQIPQDHQNHAPDGMCNVKRQAVVSGRLNAGQFYASKFELKPAGVIPDTPQFTPADLH